MTAWILSIAGVTVLSVLIDLILPSGQTSKYIKNIFAFVMILVIVSPLPSLMKGKFNINQIFESEEIVLQENFIYQVNKNKISALEETIEKQIDLNGMQNVDVSISADIFSNDMQIKEIFVDLSEIVIVENVGHIDIKKAITTIIVKLAGEVNIVFNG